MGAPQGALRGQPQPADDEQQYADRIASSEELIARGRAMQQAGPEELALLRARDTAMRTIDHRPLLLPLRARCGTCGALAGRTISRADHVLTVSPWTHTAVIYDQHQVTRVTFADL